MSEFKKCVCKEKDKCTCKKRRKKSYMNCHGELKQNHYYFGEKQKKCDFDKEKCDYEKEKCEQEKDKCDHKKEKCDHEKEKCPDIVKGYDLCKQKKELRNFQHCEPISQPCDTLFYNYFTSRTNFEFSGLVVVTNTGNPTSGCSMQVRVTDRAGTAVVVATVSQGASIPIFVEGLTSLDIACVPNPIELPVPAICSGEIIFDLEYCVSRACF